MKLSRPELVSLIQNAVQSDLRELVTGHPGANYVLWEKKTLNIHRGIVLLEPASSADGAKALHGQIRDVVNREFNLTWSWLRGFGFGAVILSRRFPSDIAKIIEFIDTYNTSRGVFQWLVYLTEDPPLGFGVHMWAEGYLSATYRRLVALMQASGVECPSFVRDKGAFFGFLQSIEKLGTPCFYPPLGK